MQNKNMLRVSLLIYSYGNVFYIVTSAHSTKVSVNNEPRRTAALPAETLTCLQCAVGKYASTDESSACLVCARGQVAASMGSVLCQGCPPGRYTTAVAAAGAPPSRNCLED